jgi:poly-beta-1,6-N-acetyl-D-glucosamine synthase
MNKSSFRDPYTGRQLSGVAALKEIATRQAEAARPPYLGPRTGDQLTALRTLERIADKSGAAVTQSFKITDSAVMRLPRITVLIPAHNEAATIAQTLRSLWNQTMPIASVTVICDNCTDDTAAVAAAEGAYVVETNGNTAKKAGALNQSLAAVLPSLSNNDYLLTMDADSALCPVWLEAGARALATDSQVGAVCGAFLGEPGGGIVGQIQRNEYFRYARMIRRRFQVPVLSGTGTLFRVRVLRQIVAQRGSGLPGVRGQYYSHASITEDDEITLAVKTLGWKCLCPAECGTLTEIMPTWKALWTQRMRWQKGALSDLSSYGWTRVTRPYWIRQAFRYAAYVSSFACLLIMGGAVIRHPSVSPAWTAGILSATAIERTWTARRGGWRAMLLAAAIIPESAYAVFLGWLFFHAAKASIQRREIAWGHVTYKAAS